MRCSAVGPHSKRTMSASVPSADSSSSRYSPAAAGTRSPSNSAFISCACGRVGEETQEGATALSEPRPPRRSSQTSARTDRTRVSPSPSLRTRLAQRGGQGSLHVLPWGGASGPWPDAPGSSPRRGTPRVKPTATGRAPVFGERRRWRGVGSCNGCADGFRRWAPRDKRWGRPRESLSATAPHRTHSTRRGRGSLTECVR